MFDVGFWEIALILVLALIVLGPERLPAAAKKVGYWVGKGRRYIEGVKYEVSKELDSAELKRLLHNQGVQIEELKNKLNQDAGEMKNSMQNIFDTQSTEKKPESQYEILEEDHMDDEVSNQKQSSTADKSE
ncbi:MAG: Sec-independent protein translocase protein TatB [Gammaproteobacteria bacterium]|nr:Sec-independent protein translocase protein TatB [Gammaproteobacteria bacterium]